jgi:hypothetical protein
VLAACSGGEPDIELIRTQTDLGVVVNGNIETFSVPVENIGGGELIIEAVTSSCGCTTAQLTPDVISAGGSGTLSITYDSGAHGPNEVGPVMRQIFIASNDPDEPEIEFRFTAEVVSAES